MGKIQATLLMTAWNTAKWVGEAVHSVMAQDIGFRFVFVDDGSRDGTLEAARAAIGAGREDVETVVIPSEHVGRAKALNLGLSCATGEYVGLVDSDDAVDEHCLSLTLAALGARPDCAGAFTDYRLYEIPGLGVRRWHHPEIAWQQQVGLPRPAAFHFFLMRRGKIEEAGRFDERFPFCVTASLTYRLMAFGPLLHVSEALYSWRHRRPGQMSGFPEQAVWHAKAVDEAELLRKELGQ